MFLPTTRAEMDRLGWKALDVLLVTGDAYIDSPFIGIAVVGHVLVSAGYRVGVIAQPDWRSDADIVRLGEPRLFWGVSGGSIDSMLANYTAVKKFRKSDDYTPGGTNNRRPDRAVVVYANLIRRCFKNTAPIVLGGIEASLRRIAHYDYWSDSVRRSILFDAKADYLVYGMAERTIVELAQALRDGADPRQIRGLCTIAHDKPAGYLELPAYADVVADKAAFIEMFHTFYRNNDPHTAKGLCQRQDTRYLVQNPPQPYLTQPELDAVYALDYERAVHPEDARRGAVRAQETIQFSIATHRGCYGECNFCAIAVHEGRTVRWRSEESIVTEATRLTQHPAFKGYIQDVSGPTANMYGFECKKKLEHGICEHKRCIFPAPCPQLPINHRPAMTLLQRLNRLAGVKKVFVASGIRYDMVLADVKHGLRYLKQVVEQHTSGQMKIAPEHTVPHVLQKMGKPGIQPLLKFKEQFYKLTEEAGKPQFLTYYLIAAHPGCTGEDMEQLRAFAARELKLHPEQVQIFTPAPSTYSSVMYYTEMDPFTGEKLFVEKDIRKKQRQKDSVTEKTPKAKKRGRRESARPLKQRRKNARA
ncbi:MAG: YgiQ family radical SAM protein [Anaerolineae bacterium]|nr:YgiQ family radical SAM protein [Anaerolineae bacterium]